MFDDETDIVRVTDLARVKAEAEVNKRAAEEVLDENRDRMEAERSERERAEF